MTNPDYICMNCMKELHEPKSVCPHCGFDNASCENAAHQLECGSILAGSYIIGRVLGQGGFGITYVGMDLNLDLKVAIKEYYPEGSVTRDSHTHISVLTYAGPKGEAFEKGKERFVSEAKTLAKFAGDSGIVGVRSFFYENGTAYIVMDYVEGETLKAYTARRGGRIPAAEALELFRPLMHSLAKVHGIGLLHRDISPDNIMLKPDGTLTLLDFGAARQMSVAGEHSNTINVKHGFAPEEQYRTRGEQGPWTDVYALAATIYRVTTGEMPPQALDRLTNSAKITPPNQLGANFTHAQEGAIMHALAVQAAYRTPSMEQFESELFDGSPAAQNAPIQHEAPKTTGGTTNFTGNGQYSAPPPSYTGNTPPVNPPKRKKNKGLIAGLIAAAAVLVVLLVIVAVNGGKSNSGSQSDDVQVISASTIRVPAATATAVVTATPTQIPQPDTVIVTLDYGETYRCSIKDFDLPDSVTNTDVSWPNFNDGSGVTCNTGGTLQATNIQFDPALSYNDPVYISGRTSDGIVLQYEVIVGNGRTYSFDWSDTARNMKTVHGYTYIATPEIPDCLGFTLMFGYDLNSGKIAGTNWSVWVRENGDTWVFVCDIDATDGDYENHEITFDRPITFNELIVQAPKEYNQFSASIRYDVTNIRFDVG